MVGRSITLLAFDRKWGFINNHIIRSKSDLLSEIAVGQLIMHSNLQILEVNQNEQKLCQVIYKLLPDKLYH